MSQYKTKGCGFFSVPLDDTYVASRDALGAIEIVAEINTGAKNDSEIQQLIKGKGSYFLQAQLQVQCKGFAN